jgi:hypothetical protein
MNQIPFEVKSKQDEILEYIIQYRYMNGGIPPAISEIAIGVKCGETNVHYHLQKLDRKGKISLMRDDRGKMVARGINIPGEYWGVDEECTCNGVNNPNGCEVCNQLSRKHAENDGGSFTPYLF